MVVLSTEELRSKITSGLAACAGPSAVLAGSGLGLAPASPRSECRSRGCFKSAARHWSALLRTCPVAALAPAALTMQPSGRVCWRDVLEWLDQLIAPVRFPRTSAATSPAAQRLAKSLTRLPTPVTSRRGPRAAPPSARELDGGAD